MKIVRRVTEIQITVVATFTTDKPLSQECGLDFWSMGGRFRAMPGKCHYEWTSDVLTVDDISGVMTTTAERVEDLINGDNRGCTKLSIEVK